MESLNNLLPEITIDPPFLKPLLLSTLIILSLIAFYYVATYFVDYLKDKKFITNHLHDIPLEDMTDIGASNTTMCADLGNPYAHNYMDKFLSPFYEDSSISVPRENNKIIIYNLYTDFAIYDITVFDLNGEVCPTSNIIKTKTDLGGTRYEILLSSTIKINTIYMKCNKTINLFFYLYDDKFRFQKNIKKLYGAGILNKISVF